MTKILVCGGRDFKDRDLLFNVIDNIQPEEIISGMAKGADSIAAEYATRFGISLLKFPADWEKHGKSAGPIRNQQMLDEGKPDLVVAFKGGRGTAHMVSIARKAGIPVKEYG